MQQQHFGESFRHLECAHIIIELHHAHEPFGICPVKAPCKIWLFAQQVTQNTIVDYADLRASDRIGIVSP